METILSIEQAMAIASIQIENNNSHPIQSYETDI